MRRKVLIQFSKRILMVLTPFPSVSQPSTFNSPNSQLFSLHHSMRMFIWLTLLWLQWRVLDRTQWTVPSSLNQHGQGACSGQGSFLEWGCILPFLWWGSLYTPSEAPNLGWTNNSRALRLISWQLECLNTDKVLGLPVSMRSGLGSQTMTLLICQSFSSQSYPDSLQPMDCRLLCPWDSSGKQTGVDCHFLLRGIFPTQGLKPRLLHCRQFFTTEPPV